MSGALTVQTPGAVASAGRFGLLRPVAPPSEVLHAQEELRSMLATALNDGRDYGVIPGTNDKKVLLKPGAERLCAAFGLAPSFRIVEKESDHDREVEWVKKRKVWENKFKGDRSFKWSEERGTALGLYRYVIECTLTHRESGAVIASALGSCSTLESKYADRPRECENTVAKMASKRALVAVTLIALGLSDQFTQDLDEVEHDAPPEAAAPPKGKWDAPPPPVVEAEPEPVVLPPLTLDEALGIHGPDAFGGKPLGDTPLKQLQKFVVWAEKKTDLSPHAARIVDGARLVIAHHSKTADELAQESTEVVAKILTDAEGADDGLPF